MASAGKAEYDILMFVNAWLAGAPHIDLLAPDIYSHDFSFWCTRYAEKGNPLFIPGTSGYGRNPRNFLLVFGEYDAIGISPFAVDSIPDPAESELARTYALTDQMSPLILEHQGNRR